MNFVLNHALEVTLWLPFLGMFLLGIFGGSRGGALLNTLLSALTFLSSVVLAWGIYTHAIPSSSLQKWFYISESDVYFIVLIAFVGLYVAIYSYSNMSNEDMINDIELCPNQTRLCYVIYQGVIFAMFTRNMLFAMLLVLSVWMLYILFSMLTVQFKLFSWENWENVVAWQGVLLGMVVAMVMMSEGFRDNQPHLYIYALLTLLLKAWLIPWMLQKQVIRLKLQREIETLATPMRTFLTSMGLVIFSYYIALPIKSLSNSTTHNTLSESLAIVLLAMLLIITRRQAVSQVVGFMAIENGLFFAALLMFITKPMIVELGLELMIAFDVLVAAVLFGVFFFEMRSSIDSLDVDQMNRLHEVDKR